MAIPHWFKSSIQVAQANPRLRRIVRSEHLHAAALLALMLVVFFWTPISRHSERNLSAADLLQDFSLLKVDPGHISSNALLSDSVTQMEPWRMFADDEFAAGRFPLWNPLNGTGCPHFANYQSAVVSPYSIPYYLFDVKTGLIAAAFLKLFSLGFLTYLFLRQIRLSFAPALLGGTAFMFAGHNVLLLTFPHVGALIVLPGGFLFVERAIQKHVAGLRYSWDLVWLTLVTLTGALAGNPEPFYFGMLLTGAYSLVRLAGTWIETRRGSRALRRLFPLAFALLVCPVLAIGMASFQTLPFLEYLQNSRVIEQRSLLQQSHAPQQTPLDPHFWPMEMFPDVLGNPSSEYIINYETPAPNYELVNTAHINGLVSFLALMAVLLVRRSRYARFFWLAGAAWACYAYNLFGVSRWFEYLPTLDLAPMNRSQGIWLFCLACLAALFLEELIRRRAERDKWSALALGAAAAVFLLVHSGAANELIAEHARDKVNRGQSTHYVLEHMVLVIGFFVAGSLLAVGLLLLRRERLRAVLALGFLPVVFFATGWHWRNYEPACEDRLFYVATGMLHDLKSVVGEDRVAILGEDSIPPMANLAWRINLLSNYDGIWVRDFDKLYRVLFGEFDRRARLDNWRPITKGNQRGLQLMATPWVLAKWNWNFLAGEMSTLKRSKETNRLRHDILPEFDARQSFTCGENDLHAVAVYLSAKESYLNRTYLFQLYQVATGRLVSEQSFTTDDVRSTVFTRQQHKFRNDSDVNPLGREVVFTFAPEADSAGKTYRYVISTKEGQSEDCIYAWSFDNRSYGKEKGEAQRGKTDLPGEMWFDFACDRHDFELVKQIGEYGLYRYKDALPTFHVVSGAVQAEDERACLAMLHSADLDLRNMVVLLDKGSSPGSATQAPAHKDAGRLIQCEGKGTVYFVLRDGKSLLWLENEVMFYANGFDFKNVEVLPKEEFERFTIVTPCFDVAEKLAANPSTLATKKNSIPEMLEQSPTRYRMKLARNKPGWLVITQARFPGWKARVDGYEVPLLRANYAFNAIAVPEGESEVEFYYEPLSLRLGLAISALSALLGLLAAWRLGSARPVLAA